MKTYNLTLNRSAAPSLGPLVSALKDRVTIDLILERLGLTKVPRVRWTES